MPFETDMLVDRVALPRRQSSAKRSALNWRALVQGTCLVLIECAGFAASTLLVVLGLPLFAFLLLAGWDLALLFAQLGNLAEHYGTAEPVARAFFAQDLQVAFLLVTGGLALLRLPGFIHRLDRRLAEEGPDNG